MSAASFQETTKVLTQASIEAKKDFLLGSQRERSCRPQSACRYGSAQVRRSDCRMPSPTSTRVTKRWQKCLNSSAPETDNSEGDGEVQEAADVEGDES
ncbi:MAG: hypothetical protein U5K69_03875 [Balneolaceae bacterium]|nr:hypothetical protein [Balneolaceae bacterium]